MPVVMANQHYMLEATKYMAPLIAYNVYKYGHKMIAGTETKALENKAHNSSSSSSKKSSMF